MSDTEDFLSSRDIFFRYLKYMWWPEIDDERLPSSERQTELVRRMYLRTDKGVLLKSSLDQFNSILTECGRSSIAEPFFKYFFPGFDEGITLGDFINGSMKFRKIALWKYGSFVSGLDQIGCSSNIQEITKDVPFDNISPVSEETYSRRAPFDFLKNLQPLERYALGYVKQNEKNAPEVARNVKEIREIAKQNTQEYLSIDVLDIYVATSMRKLEEYEDYVRFMGSVFNSSLLSKFKLRYFDPTLAYCDSRIEKSLLEALMLRRAKLTLYVAGEGDTFGKDSECAATLVQGKPVVVYVEETDDTRKKIFEARAQLFKSIHPLGLQVCHKTGVANGVIVVRNSNQCVNILVGLLTHSLAVSLDKLPDVGFILRENSTGSILRVAIDDRMLNRAFANFYPKLW
jgi:hypothetical protein